MFIVWIKHLLISYMQHEQLFMAFQISKYLDRAQNCLSLKSWNAVRVASWHTNAHNISICHSSLSQYKKHGCPIPLQWNIYGYLICSMSCLPWHLKYLNIWIELKTICLEVLESGQDTRIATMSRYFTLHCQNITCMDVQHHLMNFAYV